MRKRTYTENIQNENEHSFPFGRKSYVRTTLKQTKSFSSLHKNLLMRKQNLHKEELTDKITELRSLAKEKNQLMDELNSLKEGAVNALIEKDEMIDRLKNGLDLHNMYEDQRLQMQKELNKMKRKVKVMEEERIELKEKLEIEKKFYFEELYSRETLIDSLDTKIRELTEQLEEKSEQNQVLTSKLEIINTENEQLLHRMDKIKKKRLEEDQEEENICHDLVRAKSETEIISCLYGTLQNRKEERKQIQQNQRLKCLVNHYQLQIYELSEELERQRIQKYGVEGVGQGAEIEVPDHCDRLSEGPRERHQIINLHKDSWMSHKSIEKSIDESNKETQKKYLQNKEQSFIRSQKMKQSARFQKQSLCSPNSSNLNKSIISVGINSFLQKFFGN